MADAPRHELSSGQLVGFLISSQLGLGILGLPRYAAEGAGQAGWWIVLGAGLVSLAGAALILALCGRFRASALAINARVLGRIPGAAANLAVLAALLAAAVANLAIYLQTMKIFFFRETPVWVLALFLVAPALYQADKGLKVIGRFNTFVYLALFFLLVMMATDAPKAEWTFLLPLIHFEPGDLLGALPGTAFAFLGFILLLVVCPRVQGDPRGCALLAEVFTTLIFTAFTIFAIAFFGAAFLPKKIFPLLGIVRVWQAPVVERLDIYFLMFWLPAMGAGFTAFLIAAQLAAVELFPGLPYRLVLAVLGAAVSGGALLLGDFDLAEKAAHAIAFWEFLGLGFLLPALLHLVAWIRGIEG